MGNFSVDKLEKYQNCSKFYKLSYHKVKDYRIHG